MARRKPDAELFREKIFAYLEEKYDVNIIDNKFDDANSRDTSVREYCGLENVIAAANELVRRVNQLPPSEVPRGTTRHGYKRRLQEGKAAQTVSTPDP